MPKTIKNILIVFLIIVLVIGATKVFGIQEYIMKKMLKDNLVSFLGTDSHRKNHIYLQISKAISSISKYVSTEKLVDLVNNNAEKILKGEEL